MEKVDANNMAFSSVSRQVQISYIIIIIIIIIIIVIIIIVLNHYLPCFVAVKGSYDLCTGLTTPSGCVRHVSLIQLASWPHVYLT